VTTVFTNGCFDVFHDGHRHFLTRCMELGDRLIVAVNTDASVRELKGPARPADSLATRLGNVRAFIRPTDWVMPFDGDATHLVMMLAPDIMVKDDQYRDGVILGAEHARQLILIPRIQGISTTDILASRASHATTQGREDAHGHHDPAEPRPEHHG